jgi:GTPase
LTWRLIFIHDGKRNMSAFIDSAKIQLIAGTGGAGSHSLLRDKRTQRGGPDGGDGGNGGSVYLEADRELRTLVDFSYRDHYEAKSGDKGEKFKCTGASAYDLVIKVPCGTLVKDGETGEILVDLVEQGQRHLVAKGGRGGRGNTHFVTATRQAPILAEKGEPGEVRLLQLELKLLADIGLLGFPNAGKSSLLASCTAARPKIANYPFTTLIPQLGVVSLGAEQSFVMADLPGLIEGAAEGHGLGIQFLKHLERTRLLLMILDGAAVDGREPLADYEVLRKELKNYHPGMVRLPYLVAVNKMDLEEARQAWPKLQAYFKKRKIPVFAISAVARKGVDELIKKAYEMLLKAPATNLRMEQEAKKKRMVYKPEPRFTIARDSDEVVRLGGKEVVKWVAMTDFENDEAIRKLRFIFKKIGLAKALEEAGIEEGEAIRVGKEEFIYNP